MSERLDRYRDSAWARGPPREQGGEKARAIYQMDNAAKRIRGRIQGYL